MYIYIFYKQLVENGQIEPLKHIYEYIRSEHRFRILVRKSPISTQRVKLCVHKAENVAI